LVTTRAFFVVESRLQFIGDPDIRRSGVRLSSAQEKANKLMESVQMMKYHCNAIRRLNW
jgi:hypothetical protein